MNHWFRSRLLLIFLFALSVWTVFLSGTWTPSAAQTQPVPAQLASCLPDVQRFPNRSVLVESQFNDLRYFLIAFNRFDPAAYQEGSRTLPQDQRYFELIAYLSSNGQCKVVNNRNQVYKTLTQFVPLPVAQAFAKAQVQREINLVGLSKYQAGLDQYATNIAWRSQRRLSRNPNAIVEKFEVAPELAWAYQQQGVKLPANAVVLPEFRSNLTQDSFKF